MNKGTFWTVLLLVGMATCSTGLADELSSETTAGAGSQSEGLTFSARDSSLWSWDLGYIYSHLKQNDPTAGTITDTTHQFTGGADWEHDWIAGGGLSYSTTPSEHLTAAGPNLELGYTWKLGEESRTRPPKFERKMIRVLTFLARAIRDWALSSFSRFEE